eukprot:SAG31_NODE_28539_length_408_cov_1.171521_2_plen_59_part_01
MSTTDIRTTELAGLASGHCLVHVESVFVTFEDAAHAEQAKSLEGVTLGFEHDGMLEERK